MVVHHERDNIYRIEIRGTLRTVDFKQGQETLVDEMRRVGPIRLLILLTAFDGWESDDDWRDLTFYVKHGDTIERIAIVGDGKWKDQSLMFAAADLRAAPVEFFREDHAADARAWLAA
jgi:hypothetical protein